MRTSTRAWTLALLVTTALLCTLPAPHLAVTDETSGAMPCANDYFLLLDNATCLPCPAPCLECLPRVSDVTYPCRVCRHGNGLVLPPRVTYDAAEVGRERWTLGGACAVCPDRGKFTTTGSGSLRLNLVGAKQEEGYALEGRLEVRFGGKWGAVCDDGWKPENSHVVCLQLGLGVALGDDKQYDLLHPYLPPLDILMDDLNCTGREESVLECQFFGASSHNCEVTETIGVRCSGPELEGPFCVDRCPRGQYPDVTSGVCRNCSGRCLACDAGRSGVEESGGVGGNGGAGGIAGGQCRTCLEPYFLIESESDASRDVRGSCVRYCPPGYYGNSITRRCEQCSPGCTSCAQGINGDTCTSCASNFRLFESTCVAECPADTVLHVDDHATCRATCPPGFYADVGAGSTPVTTTTAGRRCFKCEWGCLECAGVADNCTSCSPSRVLQPSAPPGGSSASNVDKGATFSCQPRCERGTYADQDAVCRPCRVSNCSYCFRGGSHCARCMPGFFSELGRCVKSCTSGLYQVVDACTYPCPDGFYGNVNEGRCDPCAPGCRACVSPGTCVGCYGSRFLKDGACVKECGDGYLAITYPQRGSLRLLGGPTALEGGVEIYQNGIWRQVCVGGGSWTLDLADTVCKDLQLGQALQTAVDGRFGSSQTNLTIDVRCHGNESSILDCEFTNSSCSSTESLAVFCSGPDLGKINECHVMNSESCDQRPCAASVQCTDLPPGGSHCGTCPVETSGDGRKCQSTGAGGNLPSTVLLFPTRPLVIDFWPEHVQLTLPVVTAAPAQEVSFIWRKDGARVKNSPSYRIEEWGGLTLLNPSGRNVSGQYTCDIVSSVGNATVIYRVSVQESVHVKTPPRSQIVGSRGTALICEGQGYPLPRVTWLKEGVPVQSVSAQVTRQGTLILRDVRESDAGLYACVVTNGFSRATAYANVTVDAPARIVKKTAYMKAIENRPFSINCDVIGGPAPTVYWKKNGEDLPVSDRIKVMSSEMVISDVRQSDSGIYRCVARNTAGSDVWKTNLTVLISPKAFITPETLAVTMGTSVSFRCQATGLPSPIVTWYTHRRGEIFEAEMAADVQMQTSGNIHILTLIDVKPENTDHVICEAQNEAGIVTVTANLTVLGPPQWLTEPSDVWGLNQWRVTLPWAARASPEASVVWFRDGLELRVSQRYSITTSGLSFVCHYPSDSGTYTLQASNSEGSVVGSAHLEVVRDLPVPEIRHVTPTNITLYMGSLPSEAKGVTFEILVLRAGFNETRENLTTSPLDVIGRDPQEYLASNMTKTSEGYVGLIYDRLPRLVTVGDGKRYASATTKRSVLNVPLIAGEWYAVAVRLVRYSHYHQGAPGPPWSGAMFPVGATNYTLVYTVLTGSLKNNSSDRSLQTAAGIILGVVLCIILVSAAFVVFYWRSKGHLPCMDHIVLFGRVLKERTLSTTEYISKFNPHPGSGQFKPEPLGGTRGTSSETISTSVSTVYIPTEDEIDSLESIGIHYYEDDNWMSRVPSGVLGITQSRLNTLRHGHPKSHLSSLSEPLPSTSTDETSGYLHRTWSEPSLQSTPIKKTARGRVAFERTISDPSLSLSSVVVPGTVLGEVIVTDADRGGSVKEHTAGEKKARIGAKNGKDLQAAQNPPLNVSDTSFGINQKDLSKLQTIGSGFKWQTILKSLPTTKSKKWKSEIPQSTEEQVATSSATSTPRKIAKRRRRPKFKHFKNWREKGFRNLRDRGSNLWSQGRKWAKHVLDRHDAYGIQKSEDSDSSVDETPYQPASDDKIVKDKPAQQEAKPLSTTNNIKKPVKRTRTNSSTEKRSDTGSADLDCVYIDPSSIVSIPLRKIHSSGKGAPKAAIKAIKSFPVSSIEARDTSLLSTMTPDLDQFKPKAPATPTDIKESGESIPIKQLPLIETASGLPASTSGETVGDKDSPVIIRMIGKLRNRKDAEAQTDSELEDDSCEEAESTGNTGDTGEVDVIGCEVNIKDEVSSQNALPRQTLHIGDNSNGPFSETEEGKYEVKETGFPHIPDTLGENKETPVTSADAVAHTAASNPENPTTPPESLDQVSPDISHRHDSSNDSSDYIELLGSDGCVRIPPGPMRSDAINDNDANSDVKYTEADLYQSLSSFDSLTQSNADVDVIPQTENNQPADVIPSNDATTNLYLAHKDSLILPRNSGRKSLQLIHTGPVGDGDLDYHHNVKTAQDGTLKMDRQKIETVPGDLETAQPESDGADFNNHRKRSDIDDSGFHANIQSVVKKTPPKKLIIPDVFRK